MTFVPARSIFVGLLARLLAARKSFVTPHLPQLQQGPGHAEFANAILLARWTFDSGETLMMLATPVPMYLPVRSIIMSEKSSSFFASWATSSAVNSLFSASRESDEVESRSKRS